MDKYDVDEYDDWKEIKSYLQTWQASDPYAAFCKRIPRNKYIFI